MDKILAIFCSDIHLTEKPPISRSLEPDWMEAQERILRQAREISDRNNCCPVFCAGDVFDRWNPSPALINWAIEHLPEMYAIPGQHDLPLHNYGDIRKSAYWTLVEAGKIKDITEPVDCGLFQVWGFPWGKPLARFDYGVYEPRAVKWKTQILMAHRYVWIAGCGYPQARREDNLESLRSIVDGYQYSVFGDNHQAFLAHITNENVVFNCGCLIPRKKDERMPPMIGLLRESGMSGFVLDCNEDKWVDTEEYESVAAKNLELEDFLDHLGKLGTEVSDFCGAIRSYVKENEVSDSVKNILERAMEESG